MSKNLSSPSTPTSEARTPERTSGPRSEDPKAIFPNIERCRSRNSGIETPRRSPRTPDPRTSTSRSEKRPTPPMCRVRIANRVSDSEKRSSKRSPEQLKEEPIVMPPLNVPPPNIVPTSIPPPSIPKTNIPPPKIPRASIAPTNFSSSANYSSRPSFSSPTSIPPPIFPTTSIRSRPLLNMPPPNIPPPDFGIPNAFGAESLPENSYDISRSSVINNLGPPFIMNHGPVLLSPGAMDRQFNWLPEPPPPMAGSHVPNPPALMHTSPTSAPSHHIVIYPVQQERGPMRHEVFFGCTQSYCHYCQNSCTSTIPRDPFGTFPDGIWTPQPGEIEQLCGDVPPWFPPPPREISSAGSSAPPSITDLRYGPETPQTSRYNPMMSMPTPPPRAILGRARVPPPGFGEEMSNRRSPVENSPILDNPFDELDLQARLQELENTFSNLNPYE